MSLTERPEALDSLLRSSRTIVVGMGSGTPGTCLDRIAAVTGDGCRPTVFSGLLLGDHQAFAAAVADGRAPYRTWMLSPTLADSSFDPGCFLPIRVSRLPSFLQQLRPDLGIVRVSPPDARGYCSFGGSASYAPQIVATARRVVAEIDEGVPRVRGAAPVHVSSFDVLVPTTSPTPTYTARPATPRTKAIGRHVLSILPKRPVIQLGIGSVPENLAESLGAWDGEVQGFVGMGLDAMVKVMTGRGPSTPFLDATELFGTAELLEFAEVSAAVRVDSVERVGTVRELSCHDRFCSVIGALQVDLTGQVNSESIGGNLVSGPGGASDFVDAANGSGNGVSIVALPSVTDTGESRIVSRLNPADTVTIPRHSVQWVVTEHGAVDLGPLTLSERADALIGIAHPDHRSALKHALPY
ncbi:MAG: acetyl-CoA hydrolase/transferase C-terminal domain-containing protein [Nocardioidaceae bacterium]